MAANLKFARVALLLLFFAPFAVAQTPASEITLQFDPARTTAEIILKATMHTVHGNFSLKRGSIHFDPATGRATGEVVFDSTGGKTGNSSRDQTMHRQVLESQRYPEITFRPNRAEGRFAPAGDSVFQVHGLFGIHGSEHEVTIPVKVAFARDHWSATTSFQVPYVQWGLKNPSTFLLRVRESVDVQLQAAGNLSR